LSNEINVITKLIAEPKSDKVQYRNKRIYVTFLVLSWYRKPCTNTVPRFIGRRQVASTSWTKKVTQVRSR